MLLPDAAFKGDSFELDASESMPVSAVRFDNYWALQFDKFDPSVPGRIWRTEATVASTDTKALGGVRLTLLDSISGLDFNPSVPAIVSAWVKSPGLREYGTKLSERPTQVDDLSALESMCELLLNSKRTRPVVVFSEGKGIDARANAAKTAMRLAGLAHVFVLGDSQVDDLIDSFGREFSVWGGAVRTYNAGFDPFSDEVSVHPVATREWLQRRFRSHDQFIEVLLRSFTALSLRRTSPDHDLPTVRTVKQASLSYQLAKLDKPVTDERSAILEQENSLLRQQIQEKTDEFNYADAEVTAAQAERDQYRAQAMAMRSLVQRLEEQIGTSQAQPTYPTALDQVDAWALDQYPGRLVLLNRAARSAKKSPFSEPQLVYRCLDRLARQYVEARRTGNPVDALFEDLGVGLERTGDPNRLSQWKEKYFVPHRGTNRFLEWHLKRGSDHNEANTLRIYFFYDEDDEQVIIGHLPSHLTNSQT
ncbi:MAG: hypothetical protein KF892_19370 [Rhizobacter sp.]|nr:hypothetical protein [Rhizobacter sp.]